MLYQDVKQVKIYENFGHQYSVPILVIGNKYFCYDSKILKNYPDISNEIHLTEGEKLQILAHNSLDI